jgi:hypothetical protein
MSTDSSLDEVYIALIRARTEILIATLQSPHRDDATVAHRYDLVHRLLGPLEIMELTDAWIERQQGRVAAAMAMIGDDMVPAVSEVARLAATTAKSDEDRCTSLVG